MSGRPPIPGPPAALAGRGAENLRAIAARVGASSELLETASAYAKRRDNVLGLLLRDLTREEIALLETRGCRADDWAQVQVAQDFDAFRLRDVHLRGRCVLGRFSAEVDLLPGLRLSAGIWRATLVDCQIGNDCLIENVRVMAHAVVEHGCAIVDVGSLTGEDGAAFACGRRIAVGPETGGREVPVWAELDLASAAAIAEQRDDAEGLAGVEAAVAAYAARIALPVSWIRRGARIRHTLRVHASWIGAHADIDHAGEILRCAVLSSPEEPVAIGGGASLRDSVLQWGVGVGGNAIVRGSVLMEHAGADAHATVSDSLIGPNTRVEKGEITASLVGPHVGFHHQSLLIATLWPGGKGNVAYGAMVGSNHTGRAPDQECVAGEGCFFGLGCAIRFPCDLSQAPYTTVAQGVTMLPQQVMFPFSLIATPIESLEREEAAVPRAFNELIPAWALDHNAYGLVRAELKFRDRDRARRHPTDPKVLRPAVMRLVQQAVDRLRAVAAAKPVYLDHDIPGIGSNFLRDSVRLAAIAGYERALLRYALRLLMNEREGRLTLAGSAEIAHELADRLLPGTGFAERMRRLIDIEADNARLVEQSKRKDDERGQRLIPGYAAAHPPAHDDPVVRSAWERVERTRSRIAALG